ncbi:unnamed protein product [Calypogeia fissa]
MIGNTQTEERGLKMNGGVILFNVWGNAKGEFVYEGCDVLLTDGRECTLGTYARRRREADAGYPTGEHSRNRDSHHCKAIGEGRHMFWFSVQVEGEAITVWEKAGSQLFGMTGQQFKEQFTHLERRCKFLKQIMSEQWVVTYNRKAIEGQPPHNRVVEFKRWVQARPQAEVNKEQAGVNKEQAARIVALEEALRQLQISQSGTSSSTSQHQPRHNQGKRISITRIADSKIANSKLANSKIADSK